jgi:hypothetical protein
MTRKFYIITQGGTDSAGQAKTRKVVIISKGGKDYAGQAKA